MKKKPSKHQWDVKTLPPGIHLLWRYTTWNALGNKKQELPPTLTWTEAPTSSYRRGSPYFGVLPVGAWSQEEKGGVMLRERKGGKGEKGGKRGKRRKTTQLRSMQALHRSTVSPDLAGGGHKWSGGMLKGSCLHFPQLLLYRLELKFQLTISLSNIEKL